MHDAFLVFEHGVLLFYLESAGGCGLRASFQTATILQLSERIGFPAQVGIMTALKTKCVERARQAASML